MIRTPDGRKPAGELPHKTTVNGSDPSRPEGAYCTFCGVEMQAPSAMASRFGEPFCSEAHAEAFAAEVRAARVEATASVEQVDGRGPADAQRTGPGSAGAGRWSLKRLAKLAVCCSAPLLALVFLAGGGGALLGGGAAVLPYLALLACPLGMFFMMRAMQGHAKNNQEREHSTRSGDSKER